MMACCGEGGSAPISTVVKPAVHRLQLRERLRVPARGREHRETEQGGVRRRDAVLVGNELDGNGAASRHQRLGALASSVSHVAGSQPFRKFVSSTKSQPEPQSATKALPSIVRKRAATLAAAFLA
jgi:hypothetical protein